MSEQTAYPCGEVSYAQCLVREGYIRVASCREERKGKRVIKAFCISNVNFLKMGMVPEIAIIKTMKGVVKLAKIADIITADMRKFPNKNHSHHKNDGNGKKVRGQNRKI
ncbi:hypothetical protein [Nostoc sp.]|uniref:hypothetical protein n=1 Tax=Nostoc sp. TaxID=1180 RepID=UPI002FFD429C